MDLTQPIVSKVHSPRSIPADLAPSPTLPRDAREEGIEGTDTYELWLQHTVSADPAFWLKEVDY